MKNLFKLLFIVITLGQISASDCNQTKKRKLQNKQNKKELDQQRNFERSQKEAGQDWYDPRNKSVSLSYLVGLSGKKN